MRSDSKIRWDDLTNSIADGEAVLVIGPDAIPLYQTNPEDWRDDQEEQNFSTLISQKILNSPNIGIDYYYERDNLFLFKSASDKNNARKLVRDLARDTRWLPDEELLRQIVAIPFSVIINLSPDQILFKAFAKYYSKPQFGYFNPYSITTTNISEISKDNPLIYNLFGDALSARESSILDYFDLFKLISKLLSNNEELPTPLKDKLRSADSYVLLGLKMERWYSLLVLHYLNELEDSAFNNDNQNFPILSNLNIENREFISASPCIPPCPLHPDPAHTAE